MNPTLNPHTLPWKRASAAYEDRGAVSQDRKAEGGENRASVSVREEGKKETGSLLS